MKEHPGKNDIILPGCSDFTKDVVSLIGELQMADYTDPEYWSDLVKMSVSRYFIFHELSIRPMHGYEITKRANELTAGCCAPSEGAVYPLLKELELGGYVDCHSEMVSGRTRKIYALTAKGREAYAQAAEAWTKAAFCILKSRDITTDCC